MKKLLVFLKGSSIYRTAFFNLSTLYPSIELSTNTLEDSNQVLSPLFALISNSKEPLHIVGLGDYSGRNINYIRIELICKNKFRNKVIDVVPTYTFNSLFENIYFDKKELIPKSFKLKKNWNGK